MADVGEGIRTLAWHDSSGASNTIIQVRDDTTPYVWMHTNIGWVPIGNAPEQYEQAVDFALAFAKEHELEEMPMSLALYFAGYGDGE